MIVVSNIFVVAMGGCCEKEQRPKGEAKGRGEEGESFEEKELGERIMQIYRKYDVDKNGGLDRKETTQMMMDMLQAQNKPFNEQYVQQFISQADDNHDGLIQKRELYLLYKKLGKPIHPQ